MSPRLMAAARWLLWLTSAALFPIGVSAAPAFSAKEQQWIKDHPVVHIATDSQLTPLEYVEGGTYKGLVADYLAAVTRLSGLRFELVPTADWNQAQQAFLAGKVDLLPNVTPLRVNAQVREQLSFTEPYFSSPMIIVTRSDQPVILNPQELDGKVIAIRGAGFSEHEFAARFPGFRPVYISQIGDGLEMVLRGDAYASVGSEAVYLPMLRRRYVGRLGVSGVLNDMPLIISMGIRKDEPLLYSIVSKSLSGLSAHETDLIYERWAQANDYGEPSLGSLISYRRTELILLAIGIALLAWFAWWAHVARRQAQASELAKSRFLAVMSHEIRTPMNAILASIEMLQNSLRDQHDRKLAHTAATAAESLLDLLDDVLDLSKLDAHRLELELLPTDIGQLVRKVVEVAQVKANDKSLPIRVTTENLELGYVMVDPTRVRQVLMNLLSNAVKFTRHGSIEVAVRIDRGEPGRGIVSGRVTDTGIGIAKAQQKALFEAYSQADTTTTRKYGGTGLGLTICRELVELMGGSIALQSEEGVGTSVSFSLPVSLTASPPETGRTEGDIEVARDFSVGEGVVLVVEDHPQNRFILAEQMRSLGVRAELVADGRAALAAVEDPSIELVLMDCHMPEMDGYEATRRIRQREAQLGLPRVPIIAVSAATDSAHLEKCMASGMDGVLKKPLRLDELRSMLMLWLASVPTVSIKAPQAVPVAGPTVADPLQQVDLHALYRQSIEEDEAALDSAFAEGDRALVVHFAHRLKGAALMLDAKAMAGYAESVEMVARSEAPLSDAQLSLASLQEEISRWLAAGDISA
jgi:two-component system, NarL family, sensor histidine kinase EvgS